MVFDTWFGGSTDPVFLQRSGVILDPLARVPDFQLELISAGSGATYDDYYIDQISVGCAM